VYRTAYQGYQGYQGKRKALSWSSIERQRNNINLAPSNKQLSKKEPPSLRKNKPGGSIPFAP